MVKVEIDQHIFNIDDKPTLEKYNDVIQQAEEILNEVRENIYPLFLGRSSMIKAGVLMLTTLLICNALGVKHMRIILFAEYILWFLVCLGLSEFFTHEIKNYIKAEIKSFKEKYKFITTKNS